MSGDKVEKSGQKLRNKKHAPIPYRPPSEKREEFFERVERSGLSINGYLNQCVWHSAMPRQSRKASLAEIDLTEIIVNQAKMLDVLKTYDPSMDDASNRALMHEIRNISMEVRNGVFHILGKRK